MKINCTPPSSKLVALDNGEIKYSTVQNWYPRRRKRQGSWHLHNFVTKRGLCKRQELKNLLDAKSRTGSAITWKYPSCILLGDNSVGEFYSVAGDDEQFISKADTGTKMIHIGKNTSSTIISKGISAGHGQNSYRGLVKIQKSATHARNFSQCDSMLIGAKCGAHTFPYIEVKNTSSERPSTKLRPRRSARDPDFLLQRARHRDAGRGQHDRERLLQGSVQGITDGIRRRSAETSGRESRRERWLK